MTPPVLPRVNQEGFPLTFQNLLEWECQRAVRYQESFALAVVALDPASRESEPLDGDIELEIVAGNVNKEIRKTDLQDQNGETLNILLLHVDGPETLQIAERVRSRIQHYSFPGKTPNARVNRTVSIGAACYPLHSVDSSDLRERCLEALHRAQADGGNKVVVLKIRG